MGRWLVSLVGCAAFLAIVPPAGAEWQQIPAPPGGIGHLSAASADVLIVSPPSYSGQLTYSVTADRGASWGTVELAGFHYGSILGAAPDGSFRVVAAHSGGSSLQEFQVFKVDATGAAEPLGSTIPTDDGRFSDHFGALDDNGAVWIPYRTEGIWKAEIVAADGSESSEELPSLEVEYWETEETVFGPRAAPVRGPGFTSFEPRRGSYRLGSDGSFEPAEAYPVDFADGDFWYSSSTSRASWDAGAHWSELSIDPAQVVLRVGAPARFLAMAGAVAQRYSPFLYTAAGSPFPAGLPSYGIVDAGDALVNRRESSIYVEPLPLAPAPTEIGHVPADSADLTSRLTCSR